MSTSFRSQIHVKQVGSFERESSAGVERALSRCAIVDSERLGYCCDQPEKRCQELPEIDCEGALCKRQALALRSERKLPTILPLSPMATLLSAQMAQRSENVWGTGHGRGRPPELLSPFGATAPAPASGMMVTGTICS